MRPTIVFVSKIPESDGMFSVTKEQIEKLMVDTYEAGLEEGRNKALAEEYVKMTTLQMNIDNIGVRE